MTKEEIINDTISYYNEDTSRRALDHGSSCVYRARDGRNCAFGRYMKEGFLDYPICNDIATIEELLEEFELESVDDLLVEKVHGHNKDFWISLQGLHDKGANWIDGSYTKHLINSVEDIVNYYNLNKEQINVL